MGMITFTELGHTVDARMIAFIELGHTVDATPLGLGWGGMGRGGDDNVH